MRVKVAQGRDVVLEPPQFGEPLNTFGYPYAELDEKPLNHLQPSDYSYSFTTTTRD
jgi:hypothetical protein